jgi:hypothetical protein
MAPKNIYNIIFVFFLICTFLIGVCVCLSSSVNKENLLRLLRIDNNIETFQDTHNQKYSTECPDLLLKREGRLALIHSKLPKSETNPIYFTSLDEYTQYVEIQRKKGLQCPILYLQEEQNTQGETVYRMRESPLNTNPGNQVVSVQTPQIVKIQDASRSGSKFNKDLYPGFDSHGTYIGRYTTLDEIHNSTQKSKLSDNPMDTNWGGVLYSQTAIDSGKYEDRVVGKSTMVPKVFS